MFRIVLSAAAVLFGCSASHPQQCPNPKPTPSEFIYKVQSFTSDGDNIAFGNEGVAALIDPAGLLLTARHVVSPRLDEDTGQNVKLVLASTDGENRRMNFETLIEGSNPNGLNSDDWALLYAPELAEDSASLPVIADLGPDGNLNGYSIHTLDRFTIGVQATQPAVGEQPGPSEEDPESAALACSYQAGIYARVPSYQKGFSGSPVLDSCNRVVAVTSRYRQPPASYLEATKQSLPPMLDWIAAQLSTAPENEQLPDYKRRLENIRTQREAESAFQDLEALMDDADFIVVHPTQCIAKQILRKFMHDEKFTLPVDVVDVARRIREGRFRSGTIQSIAQQKWSGLQFVELTDSARIAFSKGHGSQAHRIAISSQIRKLASNVLFEEYWDQVGPLVNPLAGFPNARIVSFQPAEAVVKLENRLTVERLSGEAFLDKAFASIETNKGDEAVRVGREALRALLKSGSAVTDQEKADRVILLETAIAMMLSGLNTGDVQKWRTYYGGIVADIAVALQQRRLSTSSESDRMPLMLAAERAAALAAVQTGERVPSAWEVAYLNAADMKDWAAAWYLNTVTALSRCPACGDAVVRQTSTGVYEPMAIDGVDIGRCEFFARKALELMSAEELLGYVGAPTVNRSDDPSSSLPERDAFEELKRQSVAAITTGESKFVLPHTGCAPLSMDANSTLAADPALKPWIAAARFDYFFPAVPRARPEEVSMLKPSVRLLN